MKRSRTRSRPAPAPGAHHPLRIAYYDDGCGFCRRCRDVLQRADREARILWIGSHDRASHRHTLSDAELAASLIVFETQSGRRHQRAQGLASLAKLLPFPYRLLQCAACPLLAPLADRAYDHIAQHRGWLSRHLGHDLCDVNSAAEGPRRGRDSESVRG